VGLAKRIIPTLLIDRGNLVKGKQFEGWRVVGNPIQAASVHNIRQVDEMVVFDVTATKQNRPPDYDTIYKIATVNFVPLTVGGNICSKEIATTLVKECGADKIALGSHALSIPGLTKEIGEAIGCQSVVAVLSRNRAFKHLTHIGEIIIQSVERDGTFNGYDLEAIRSAVKEVNVPVVASSGCGTYEDMNLALMAGADAVAAGALWQFTRSTPKEAKEYLEEKGWEVRL
tara:strand:+ start:1199 stop:1885 length:687 start_codon:yes stop_codon:yes gene_type:complete